LLKETQLGSLFSSVLRRTGTNALPRIRFSGRISSLEFEAVLSGVYPWVRRLRGS